MLGLSVSLSFSPFAFPLSLSPFLALPLSRSPPSLSLSSTASSALFHHLSAPGSDAADVVVVAALRLSAKLSLFEVKGLANNRPAPTLLSSRKAATVTGTPLLDILFETNPLDESADQRLRVESQPLEIIYDAVSVFLSISVCVSCIHNCIPVVPRFNQACC